MPSIQDVLVTDPEFSYDIVERALKATNWPQFLITEKNDIRVPKRAGRVLNVSRDKIKELYLSREELLENPPSNFHLINHPMINHKLTVARKVETGESEFERLIREISLALSVYATEDLEEEPIAITTPICDAMGTQIAGLKPTVVPIWRAGEGMKPGVRSWLSKSRVGNMGMYRNHETLLPTIYYAKLLMGFKAEIEEAGGIKNIKKRPAYIMDPMLATGVSAVTAIEIMKSFGYRNIKFLAIVSAPQGVNALLMAHPDVEIYVAALDPGLDEKGYIVEGLGDAGKRLNGTDWDDVEDFTPEQWDELIAFLDQCAS